MNRLEQYFREPQEPEQEKDYFVVDCGIFDSCPVSLDTAIDIERRLEERPPARWIIFRDLAGARHRILAEQIRHITESTSVQRAARRAFCRARRLEAKADRRPWEEDDDD